MRFPPRRPFRRRKFLLGAAGLGLVVASCIGAWQLWGPAGESEALALDATVSTETVKSTVSVSGTLARVGSKALSSAVDAAESARDAAVTQYGEVRAASSDSVQVAAAEAALVSARDDLAAARSDLAAATLRSTVAGTVTVLDLAVGDVVGSTGSGSTSAVSPTGEVAASSTTTSSAVRVVKPGRFVVEATVPAAQIVDVSTSQQATLSVSGADETVFATVSDVSRVAQADSSGGAVFAVTLTVTGTRDDLYAGSTVNAEIVTEQRADVLVVPSQALRTDEEGAMYVTVRDGDDTERRAVSTGETYGTSTEVLDGLEEGEVVVLAQFRAPQGGDTSGEDTGQGGAQDQMMPPGGGVPGGGGVPPSFPGGSTGGSQ